MAIPLGGGFSLSVSLSLSVCLASTRALEQKNLSKKRGGSINQVDITLINIYTPNTGAPKYKKERLLDLKGEIDYNTLIVGDINTPVYVLDRSSR